MTSAARFRKKAALPYAFTEHGVSMLASVLRSEKAVQMSIAVVIQGVVGPRGGESGGSGGAAGDCFGGGLGAADDGGIAADEAEGVLV